MAEDLGTVIDIHHHWIPREIADTMERQVPEGYKVERDNTGNVRIFDPAGMQVFNMDPDDYAGIERRFEHMDYAGIDVAMLSAACFPSWITLRAARLMNDAATDILKNYGDRLQPMVHVPPFGEDGILEEMERGANLGLKGVCIATNFKGLYPDEDEYLPFLRKAAELDLPVFIHAAGSMVHAEDLYKYNLVRSLGRSVDHTLIAVRMLYSGIMAGLPNLKIVVNHLGGSFFANIKRYTEMPADKNPIPEGGYESLLDRMLFDTAPSFWYGATEIECAVKNLGAQRIALGSDYPANPAGADPRWLKAAVDHIRELSFGNDIKRKIAGENVQEFFGLSEHAGHQH